VSKAYRLVAITSWVVEQGTIKYKKLTLEMAGFVRAAHRIATETHHLCELRADCFTAGGPGLEMQIENGCLYAVFCGYLVR